MQLRPRPTQLLLPETAGVVLCRQHARVAVWAEDSSIAAEPRLDEYEARCYATQHARWALRAAGLHDARRVEMCCC